MARQLASLLWRRALSAGAGPSVGSGPRLGLLAAGRLKAEPALGRACLTPDRARGLHGGPGLEERAEGAAGRGRPESGTAGTGLEEGGGGGDPSGQPGARSLSRSLSVPLFTHFLLESQSSYSSRAGRDFKDVGTNFAFNGPREKLTSPKPQTSEWPHRTLGITASLSSAPFILFLESREVDLAKV